jgi:hypothetical protein
MVKKVFYIEKEKFLRTMMELALRAKNAEIYTVETISGNFYLIDDLAPDLIIFDLSIELDDLEKLYTYYNRVRLVATGPAGSENSLDFRVTGFLVKPLVIKDIAEKVLSLVD